MDYVGYSIDFATEEQKTFGVRSMSVYRKNVDGRNYKIRRLIKEDIITNDKELKRIACLDGKELLNYKKWEKKIKRVMRTARALFSA